MPKKRQITYLHAVILTDGTTIYHWKPSPRLRAAGFTNIKLGSDRRVAIARAEDQNEAVARWAERGAAHADGTPADQPVRAPRIVRFGELVMRYRADTAFTGLKPKTRAEYGTRLRQLESWALDGELAVKMIDRQMVLDLRRELIKGSPFRAAAILRVLRLLLAWAVDNGLVRENAALKIDVPEPPKRRARIIRDDLAYLLDAARAATMPHIELGIVLGFYTTQREGDLLKTTRFTTREVRDISDDAKRALAGPDGRVLGIALEQGKTGAQVSIPLVPVARAALERAMPGMGQGNSVASSYLIQRPGQAGECPEWRFQRDFRVIATVAPARAVQAARALSRAGDHDGAREAIEAARRLRNIQFRDMRRSGMCWMRDLGVPVALIAAISGHSIEQTQKILDTYLPRDTRAAAEAMAMAVNRQAERDRDQAGDREKGSIA